MTQGFVNAQNITLPLAVSQGGTGVTTSTGTGSVVLSNSPTITTPKIAQVNDVTNNTPSAGLVSPAGGVNYITLSGQVTGAAPEAQATGSDTNIGINLRAKGTGGFALISAATTQPLTVYNGTSSQHSTTFAFSNTAAAQTVTFPDASGTVAFTSDIPAAATQANQETATSTTTYVSPGRQQFHPSAAKWWVVYTATPTLTTSYNVSSISSAGTGLTTVNFTTSFSSADYSIAGVSNTASAAYFVFVEARNTGSCQLQAVRSSTEAGTAAAVTACGFGDQ